MAAAPGEPGRDGAEISIRAAIDDDLPAIQQIYAHHVLHGVASFEYEPPALAEMRRRFEAIVASDDPYLVADCGGEIGGYAYASAYRPRPGYRFVREGSVYVAPGMERRGIGRGLLAALIEACTAKGYRRLIGIIGDSDHAASIGLHESLGFRRVGLLPSVGFKFGRWVDSVIMDLPLGEGDRSLPDEAETG